MIFNNSLGFLICFLGLIIGTKQNIRRGVDLVTELSNNLIPRAFKEAVDNENFIIGPFGLASNIAMMVEGTSGKTKLEILRALNISGSDVDDMRKGFKAYCDLFLEHSSHAEAAGSFNTASVQSSLKLLPAYKATLSKHYCANITELLTEDETSLEFGSDAGVMSHWRDYEKLAVYTFLSHQALLPFTKRNGSIAHVPMIPQVGVFKAARWENSEIILLPLQAKLVHLLLIIPDDIGKIENVINNLHKNTLPNLIESLPKEEIEIFIPQLTAISKNLNLTSLLRNTGIKLAFDKKANFTKAADKSNHLYLKKVNQNAYFSTSFVALNSVAGVTSSLELRRTKRDAKKFYIDRPFLFFILHKDTQLALLAGKIENPIQVPS